MSTIIEIGFERWHELEGIPGGSNSLPTTTMGFTFFVLSKGFSSCTYIRSYTVEEEGGLPQGNVTKTFQEAVQSYHKWDSGTNLENKLVFLDLMLHSPL